MKIVSLTLARGGSKGVPRKNIISVNDRPLISYVIDASLESKVDETWVSTEDGQIATVSEMCGAKVIRRPDDMAQDTSKGEEALLHFANNVDFFIASSRSGETLDAASYIQDLSSRLYFIYHFGVLVNSPLIDISFLTV